MVEAYPLQWPVGYKRASVKTRAPFKTAFAKARDEVIFELQKLGAKNIVISTNIPVKRDGLPYSVPFGQWKSISDDTGIAVYFTLKQVQKVICCDAYLSFDDNMHAINKTVEALRGIERWDCSDIINQTFTGFKALDQTSVAGTWFDVLGVTIDASEDEIKEAYRKQAATHHPDKGGSAEQFSRVYNAYKQGLSSVKQTAL